MLHVSYDPRLVVVSIAVAFVAAFAALTLSARMLAARSEPGIPGGTLPLVGLKEATHGAPARGRWLIAAAMTMGLGIWTMHFIAMLAFSIGVPVTYRVDLTLFSMLLAAIGTWAAFLRVARRPSRRSLAEAGAFMGAAIVAMHYTGMAAFSAPARLIYAPGLVALSVLIAVAASTTALWTAFKGFGDQRVRIAAAGLLAAAVSGMHYTGMAAVSVLPGGEHQAAGLAVDTSSLAIATIAAVLALAAVCLVAAYSDRRIAEAAAREAEMLRLAQKMEATGHLAGGIAHDFANILQIVAAGLELMAKGRSFAEVGPSMRQAVQRGQAATGQLLAFARRRPLKPERIDLGRFLAENQELLSKVVPPGTRFSVLGEADIRPVEVDPDALALALLNLVINARDAMPDGGAISMSARNVTVGPGEALARATGLSGDLVEIRIADTGQGMAPEVLARAFEPFFTTKDAGAGTGLGLPQVYGFVRQSNGGIHVDSAPGRGTVVHVLLPSAERAGVDDAGTPPEENVAASDTVRPFPKEPAGRFGRLP